MIVRRMKQPGVPTNLARVWSSSLDLLTRTRRDDWEEVGVTCNASLCEYAYDVASMCGRCKVFYCSPERQKDDWPSHKRNCAPPRKK
ncbi:hypothetical protein DL93DRAFT_2086592 [Clavulina sp. PMI_390]|nr:hypothetical protein DL93DRAFT_2086592 [Clavulina sp. PMI_390]